MEYTAEADYRDVLLKFMPGGMLQCLNDGSLTILWMSDVFCELAGYTREEIAERFGGGFLPMVCPEDRERLLVAAKRQQEQMGFTELEYRIVRRDGSYMWVMDKGRGYETQDGRKTLISFVVDISERKRIEEELRLSLERYQVIMSQTTNIIFEWDMVKDTLFFSANWEKKFGYKALDAQISTRLPQSSNINREDLNALMQIMDDMRQGKSFAKAEFRIANIMGEYTWCRIQATAQYNDGHQPIKAVGVILDIEEEKRQRQELLKEARQDALTGLLNKTEAKRRTEEYMSKEYTRGTMLLMDLDDFKGINDRYGHLCGDAVLSDTAAVLRKLFRSDDVIGRIGGDEFLLFLPGIGKKAAGERAHRISSLLKSKRLPDPKDVIRISVGVAEWPEDAESFFDLYKKADLALYRSKGSGKDHITLYDEESCGRKETGAVLAPRSGSVIESEEMTDVEEQLVSYTFHMLYHSQNIEEAVNQLLEIVGRAYDVSRVYIFESSLDGKCCNNTFEWCNEGVAPQMDVLQNISYEEDLGGYVGNFDESGVFYCEDIRKLGRKLYAILAPQEVKSMLQCAIIDDKEFKGYVGFDECRQNRYWTREQVKSLGLIANILSEFLLKHRLKEQIRQMMEGRPQA